MRIESNWALFVEGTTVKWTFGNPDDEFLQFVLNFLTALSQIGEELFGQHGIAQINFDIRKHVGFHSSEVFIVSLMNKFFLIMSDPAVTMKLIDAHGGITKEVEEIMSAVLVGQAAMLYSQSISTVTPEIARTIEAVWQAIILDISEDYQDDLEKIVGHDSSNFSILPFQDLLWLHYLLRKRAELTEPLTNDPWALISHMSGGEVPLVYNVPKDPVVLAGYLAIIISFLMSLFESKPKSLIFGTNSLTHLLFVHGDDYFLAIDAPFSQITNEDEFKNEFFNMENKVLKDLEENLKKRTIEEILTSKSVELEKMNMESLLIEASRTNLDKKLVKKGFLRRIFGI